MNVKTGGKELLVSSTFIALDEGETTVELDKGDGLIRIIMDFAEDPERKQSEVDWNFIDATTLKLGIVNWHNTLGTILTQPVFIGTYFKRELYITFSVYMVAPKTVKQRIVTLALYLGKEVQNAAG